MPGTILDNGNAIVYKTCEMFIVPPFEAPDLPSMERGYT